SSETKQRDPGLVQKFFDYLEANAEDLWHVPSLEVPAEEPNEESEELFSAAYEDVTYKDSTDDDEESSVAGGTVREVLDLEQEGPRLERSLRFQSTLARLWGVAARAVASETWSNGSPSQRSMTSLATAAWRNVAREHLERLLALLDAISAQPIPS